MNLNLVARTKENLRAVRVLVALALSVVANTGASPVMAQSESGAPAISQDAKFIRAAEFLTRIRLADPEYKLILMAGFKETELSLLLNRYAKPAEMPVLIKGLLEQLSKAVPGTDLSVIAFWPTVPLREAGIARLNAATREVTYTAGWVPPRPEPVK